MVSPSVGDGALVPGVVDAARVGVLDLEHVLPLADGGVQHRAEDQTGDQGDAGHGVLGEPAPAVAASRSAVNAAIPGGMDTDFTLGCLLWLDQRSTRRMRDHGGDRLGGLLHHRRQQVLAV